MSYPLDKFPLQRLVEKHGCKYFAENDTYSGEILNLALQSPFIRLYALNRRRATVAAQRLRFQHNERIQLFAWTQERAWLELVRLVPVDQPSVFWMHPPENVGRALTTLGKLRPNRQDVLVFEVGRQRGIVQMAERHFRHTHWLAHFPDAFNEVEILRNWEILPVVPGSFLLLPRAAG